MGAAPNASWLAAGLLAVLAAVLGALGQGLAGWEEAARALSVVVAAFAVWTAVRATTGTRVLLTSTGGGGSSAGLALLQGAGQKRSSQTSPAGGSVKARAQERKGGDPARVSTKVRTHCDLIRAVWAVHALPAYLPRVWL